jgi:hypothetical protein
MTELPADLAELLRRMELELTDEEEVDVESAASTGGKITYSGQDFDAFGLVRRLNSQDIVIPRFGDEDDSFETDGFQRGFVWNRPQMDKFIESLLLGFPIPGIFLVKQKDKKYLVLDGQQRLLTLQHFYSGSYRDKTYRLQNVADEFMGLTYTSLTDQQRRTLDDTFIQATIVNTDGSAESLDAIYQVFERLNSGGTQLTPHQIRVALYAGKLVSLLEALNRLPHWRELYGPKNVRIRDQELILRILALYCDSDEYSRPLKSFLNEFADRNRDASDAKILEAANLFDSAAKLLASGPGPEALRKLSRQVNAAQTEAIFFGLMKRLASAPLETAELESALERLKNDAGFDTATTRSTADEDVVTKRLSISQSIFAEAAQ